MKLLDLFCGAGGAAMGYHQAGFDEIVGVDHLPQPRYPFEFVQVDAFEYLAEYGQEFDVIHASPPCQCYVGWVAVNRARGKVKNHPDLIDKVRQALQRADKPYVIENVQGAPLETQIILCGHSLGLLRLARHRHFESNVMMMGAPRCTHRKTLETIIGVYGKRPDGHRVAHREWKFSRTASSIKEAQEIMGIDWMTWDEIKEAIPPAYTEWIGKQLLRILEAEHVQSS
jgi:DNA (cytosine-5)-methyltransferase 1